MLQNLLVLQQSFLTVFALGSMDVICYRIDLVLPQIFSNKQAIPKISIINIVRSRGMFP